MKKIAPDIFRQRLLIEGYYETNLTQDLLRKYLLGIAEHLGLKTYGEPIIFSPESGMGKEENQGFDAFVPLIDSGISVYGWSNAKFISAVFYTCKGFDETAAIDYTRNYFHVPGELVHISF